MKNNELYMLVALALAGVYLLMKPKGANASTTTPGAKEINVNGDANGWRYFDDGTAIDPYGTYYKNGVQIWNPMM
ncbi:hypothetical protein D0T21_06925 [Duganella sp. BJB476]|nr:hypothetical protein D0T21_06925 [Duganella sp. BJB476]